MYPFIPCPDPDTERLLRVVCCSSLFRVDPVTCGITSGAKDMAVTAAGITAGCTISHDFSFQSKSVSSNKKSNKSPSIHHQCTKRGSRTGSKKRVGHGQRTALDRAYPVRGQRQHGAILARVTAALVRVLLGVLRLGVWEGWMRMGAYKRERG